MKKLFTFILTLITLQTFAQDNVIKLNIPSLFFKNIYGSYERNLNDKYSLTLDASVLIPKKIPSIILDIPTQDEIKSGEFNLNEIETMKVNGFHFTPGIRFYPSENGLKGFYVEGYIRYRRYYFDHDFIDHNTYNANLSGSWSKIGAGVNIGAQWILNDHISIDFTIIGIDLSQHTFIVEGTTNNPDVNYDGDNEYLKNALPLLDTWLGLGIDASENTFRLKANAFLIGFRNKLTIGVAF